MRKPSVKLHQINGTSVLEWRGGFFHLCYQSCRAECQVMKENVRRIIHLDQHKLQRLQALLEQRTWVTKTSYRRLASRSRRGQNQQAGTKERT